MLFTIPNYTFEHSVITFNYNDIFNRLQKNSRTLFWLFSGVLQDSILVVQWGFVLSFDLTGYFQL